MGQLVYLSDKWLEIDLPEIHWFVYKWQGDDTFREQTIHSSWVKEIYDKHKAMPDAIEFDHNGNLIQIVNSDADSLELKIDDYGTLTIIEGVTLVEDVDVEEDDDEEGYEHTSSHIV